MTLGIARGVIMNQAVGGGDAPAAAPFTAEAVTFDGTNDHLDTSAGAISNATDNKVGTLSFWLKPSVDNVFMQVAGVANDTANRGVARIFRWTAAGNNNRYRMDIWNASGAQIGEFTTAFQHTAASGWAHVILSWDFANTSNRAIYVNDSLDSTTWTTYTNDTIDWDSAQNEWDIASGGLINSYSNKVNGDLAEVYFTNEYIDLSVEANRRKFINADGTPVFLGFDGSKPTGTAPLVYMSGAAATWNAGTNSSGNGNFTMTGAVTDSTNEPVDAI